jgi:arylsulfatase A-like enzyme
VPKEWSDKYKGKFDQGWDKLREETFARQKQLAVIPTNAKLTPRGSAFPAWDSASSELRKVYARQMEVYAGYQENTEHAVGKVVQAIEDMGLVDNTLIIYIWGDNGASMEGTETGTFNEMTTLNGIPLTADQQLKAIEAYGGLDKWGGPNMAPHYAAAWAWAGNTPFQWGKQVASHLGGIRDPMVIAWPKRIKDKGGMRSHFTHCTDIAPTILEAAGLPQPREVNGVVQMPMHGVSFLSTFDDANAPSRHTQQYFEILGNRAMYKDGWIACWRLNRIPWKLDPETLARFAPGKWDPDSDKCELYNLTRISCRLTISRRDIPIKCANLPRCSGLKQRNIKLSRCSEKWQRYGVFRNTRRNRRNSRITVERKILPPARSLQFTIGPIASARTCIIRAGGGFSDYAAVPRVSLLPSPVFLAAFRFMSKAAD